MSETVAVIGASPKPERYSNQAIRLLKHHGHTVIPVNPAQTEIEQLSVVKHVRDLPPHVDTLTMYVSPSQSDGLLTDIITVAPRRVIFNPGAENPTLEKGLLAAGIHVENACTLVLLRTHQF